MTCRSGEWFGYPASIYQTGKFVLHLGNSCFPVCRTYILKRPGFSDFLRKRFNMIGQIAVNEVHIKAYADLL
jgi:hypothetical protein